MALLWIALPALALLLPLLFAPRWRARRRARLMRRPFPAAWRRVLRRHMPQYARLPPPQQQRLRQLIQVFLAEKEFIGCAGLKVTTAMRVLVAAQACLLLLGRERGFYPQLRQILLYPDAFVVPRQHRDGSGVLSEGRQVLAGESWSQGQVILSWQHVLEGAADCSDGRSVVIHEFAHQLDQEKGHANGAPLLGSRAAYARWSTLMQSEFDALRQSLSLGHPTLLDPYAASDPAEFFAVLSECFFERGEALATQHPALYELMTDFYRVSPRTWG